MKSQTNGHGFFCQKVAIDLLPEIGIPHKHDRRDGNQEWYWRASRWEDLHLGIDVWITLIGCGEVAVDITIISDDELIPDKRDRALERGVVPLFLEQGMLIRASNGSRQALQEYSQEVRLQIPLKLRQLKGERMTRELAAQKKGGGSR